jgi:hypothetical protein
MNNWSLADPQLNQILVLRQVPVPAKLSINGGVE